MFSLVIVIVAIALVVVLALTSTYYGGEVWGRASESAAVTRLANEQQQLLGAAQMHLTDKGRQATSMAELQAAGYLKDQLSNSWTLSGKYVVSGRSVEDSLCLAYNQKHGVPLVPRCDDPAYLNKAVCCSSAS